MWSIKDKILFDVGKVITVYDLRFDLRDVSMAHALSQVKQHM
jgi:hypothetical protein